MGWVKLVLQVLSNLTSLLQGAQRRRELAQARKDGANASYVEGSKEVDKKILDAQAAADKVVHTDDAIANDPNRRD